MPNKFKISLSVFVMDICYCIIAFVAYKLRMEYPTYTLIILGCLVLGAITDTIMIKKSRKTMEWTYQMLQIHPEIMESMKNQNKQ
ncbi:hypothetical protein [Clostridium magnum]|uniref:Uncharacterized protein n=1 Tax=Clostridium magnum DSM 2767 TaxID=1121326 RepID=A0A161YPU1_9CLOT|nr:hypothetical protein [Clostridium magnum]KZL92812.1 hypothetical protein CLMAG_26260 [Clostridium magnum DSM 2767]SHI28584.1 hypothetical protein SAMN02745944_04018 [Clostridium magnum DSM 2767]